MEHNFGLRACLHADLKQLVSGTDTFETRDDGTRQAVPSEGFHEFPLCLKDLALQGHPLPKPIVGVGPYIEDRCARSGGQLEHKTGTQHDFFDNSCSA